MPDISRLHCPPRRPHAWIAALLVSQALVVVVWARVGWQLGLPAMAVSHLAFWWGTLKPQSAFFNPVLSRLPVADTPDAEKRVWLTIDDGPSDETQAVLDLLDLHEARATFFLVGERAAARPDLVRAIAQRGHGIGNHSQTHPQAWFWALGPTRMRREIVACQDALVAITGHAPRWFRAVVGMSNPFTSAPMRDCGLARVAWSARGFDGVERVPEKVVARIERDLAPGAIVLLHEGAPHGGNVPTIALLLRRFDALGYRTCLPET